MPQSNLHSAQRHGSGVDHDRDAGRMPRNRIIHVVSLSATKTADALIDPKLVLSWLMSTLGAPAYLIGALVPVREAGALLPQLLVARIAGQSETRKQFWSLGAAIQGLMALVIAASALFLEGVTAGWAIVAALGILAIGRSIASTTYKDALAHSVVQGHRGAVTGAAGSIAATLGLAYGASMAFGIWGGVSQSVVATFVLLAGGLFLTASIVFLGLRESDAAPTRHAQANWREFFAPLFSDRDFQWFILARALLTPTALAPPFIIMATVGTADNSLTDLGPLVVASALAAVVSAYIWGRVSDKSSRLALILSGTGAAIVYVIIPLWSDLVGGQMGLWAASLLMFSAQVCYQGVRSGRSIYLTDSTTDDTRLGYTALSNTLIGAVLLAGLGLGGLAHVAGPGAALLLCAGSAAAGALVATRLSAAENKAEAA